MFLNFLEALCRVYADFIKYICINEINVQNNKSSLESFVASRLVPMDKNPGLRPIGVGEVLRRIAGKVIMSVIKNDITKAVGNLQLCGGQEAGCEAAIHAMRDILAQTKLKQFYLSMQKTHLIPSTDKLF